MTLTIGIKALNEARHVAAAIDSALDAARPFGGEVLLADGGSSDGTIEIARERGIRIVQLVNVGDTTCGACAQLAFQHARGEFFYLLDGDMVLQRDFIPAAITYLRAHGDVAGVGGMLEEANTSSHEFRIRAISALSDKSLQPGIVDRLDGGGLYRTAAVRDVGYFADCNLHGFEEFDLAARLQYRGWKLARIGRLAVTHYGHTTAGYRLLWRRHRARSHRATGEVVRSAWGKPHWTYVLRRLSHVRHAVLVIAWWLLLGAALISNFPTIAVLSGLVAPLAWLSFRRGSLRLGLFSFVSWNFSAVGLLSGVSRTRRSPTREIPSVELSSLG